MPTTMEAATTTPFLYDERSLYSQLAAAVARMTPIHLSELACRRLRGRGRKAQESAGRSDMWCHYRNTDFVIELKKQSVGLGVTPDQDHRLVASWNRLKAQTQDSQRHYADWTGSRCRVALGLMAILPYSGARCAKADWQARPQAETGLVRTLTQLLGDGLAFFAHAPLPDPLQEIEWEGEDGNTFVEFSPFVAIAGTWSLIEG